MANRYATKAGNWSDVTVWDGGTTLPGPGDVVRPNNFIVTIDQDIVVAELTNNAAAPASANGRFNVLGDSPRSITADIVARGGVPVFRRDSGSGTVYLTGNISVVNSITAAEIFGTGYLFFTGNIIGAAGGVNGALYVSSAANISVVGNISVTGSTANSVALIMGGIGGSLDITGDVSSGLGTSSWGVSVTSNNTPTHIRNSVISATSVTPAIRVSATTGSPITVGDNVVLTTPNGRNVIDGVLVVSQGATNVSLSLPDSGSPPNQINLSILGSSNPDPGDVREGTAYADGVVGTLAVPPVESVASGVPVDNTVGTASLDLETVAGVIGQQIAAAVSAVG